MRRLSGNVTQPRAKLQAGYARVSPAWAKRGDGFSPPTPRSTRRTPQVSGTMAEDTFRLAPSRQLSPRLDAPTAALVFHQHGATSPSGLMPATSPPRATWIGVVCKTCSARLEAWGARRAMNISDNNGAEEPRLVCVLHRIQTRAAGAHLGRVLASRK